MLWKGDFLGGRCGAVACGRVNFGRARAGGCVLKGELLGGARQAMGSGLTATKASSGPRERRA